MTSRANSLISEPSCSKNLKYMPGSITEPPTILALRGQFKSVQKLIGSCKSPDIANSIQSQFAGKYGGGPRITCSQRFPTLA
jgi:hypothetical protein